MREREPCKVVSEKGELKIVSALSELMLKAGSW